MTIPQIRQLGAEFYHWAETQFYDSNSGEWHPEHPWGTCTWIAECARVLLEMHGYKTHIVGLEAQEMPTWWQSRYPTGHDWARTEGDNDVDLWPVLYGDPGFTHPPLPMDADAIYWYDEPSPVRQRAEADVRAFMASRNGSADFGHSPKNT